MICLFLLTSALQKGYLAIRGILMEDRRYISKVSAKHIWRKKNEMAWEQNKNELAVSTDDIWDYQFNLWRLGMTCVWTFVFACLMAGLYLYFLQRHKFHTLEVFHENTWACLFISTIMSSVSVSIYINSMEKVLQREENKAWKKAKNNK